MQRCNFSKAPSLEQSTSSSSSSSSSSSYAKSLDDGALETCHQDAFLLASFAEIATKEALSQTCSLPDDIVFTSSPLLQARPRLVSDTSINDRKWTSFTKSIIESSHNKVPIEIRPHNEKEELFKHRVVYRTILKKKFSWKNYPPLEQFLIANRDEYLRHSTLNYTVQQKHYNNHLTKQMIELAAQCNLVFDENDFSFVTIRDRIRCYYKSYVQSLKKRGILLGYAARKAGLVSDNDIELSASTAGKIYLPKV
jgi:hypothetical protein